MTEPKDAANSNTLGIQAGQYDSLYEHIIKPDRAVYLPGYFKRWVKYLGADLAWMYVSFRQAAYMDGGRDGAVTSRFTAAEVANRAGITERTFWNRAANPETWNKLKGLVTRTEEDAKWDLSSGMPKQLPRQFTVAMTLPLIPADAAALSKWLTHHIERYNGAEGALRAAASASIAELLPANIECSAEVQPMTVRQLARSLFGELDSKLLNALSSAIQNNIMPSNDQIKITVFFMEHILGYLGTGPGWIVTLMRDKCFDTESETRNRVVVRDGYTEIAAWLGISRVKTVWEWLNQKKDGRYLNPVLRLYLREQIEERDYDRRERTFHVLLEEIPFELLEAYATGKGELLLKGRSDLGGNFSLGLAEFSGEDFGANFSHALAEFSAHLGAFFSHALAEFSVPFGANFSVKSSLTPPENSQTPPTQPAQDQPEPAQSGGRAGWSFSEIAKNNALNPKGRQELTRLFPDEQELGRKFLAWILYAYSPLGRGLTDASGVSKAVKSLSAEQPEFAPNKFELLAKLGLQKLQELFDRDYARESFGKSVEARIYESNFKKLAAERKAELYFALFGKQNPEPAEKPQKTEQPKTAYQLRLAEIKAKRQAGVTAGAR